MCQLWDSTQWPAGQLITIPVDPGMHLCHFLLQCLLCRVDRWRLLQNWARCQRPFTGGGRLVCVSRPSLVGWFSAAEVVFTLSMLSLPKKLSSHNRLEECVVVELVLDSFGFVSTAVQPVVVSMSIVSSLPSAAEAWFLSQPADHYCKWCHVRSEYLLSKFSLFVVRKDTYLCHLPDSQSRKYGAWSHPSPSWCQMRCQLTSDQTHAPFPQDDLNCPAAGIHFVGRWWFLLHVHCTVQTKVAACTKSSARLLKMKGKGRQVSLRNTKKVSNFPNRKLFIRYQNVINQVGHHTGFHEKLVYRGSQIENTSVCLKSIRSASWTSKELWLAIIKASTIFKVFKKDFILLSHDWKCLNFWPTSASQITMRGSNRYKSTRTLLPRRFECTSYVIHHQQELHHVLYRPTRWWSCTFETSG